MKNMKILALSLISAAALMASCQKESVPQNGKEGLFSITGTKENVTRTIIDGDKQSGFKTLWEVGDKVGVVAAPNAEGPSTLYNYPLSIADESAITDNLATFTGVINGQGNQTYTFYTYYPHVGGNATPSTANLVIPCSLSESQTMHGDSYDRNYDYMIGSSFEYTFPTGSGASNVSKADISFRYVVGFVHLSLADIVAGTDAADMVSLTDEVVSVEMTANVPDGTAPDLTGDFNFNLADGTTTFAANDGTRNHIKLNTTSGMTLGTLNAWFISKPFDLPSNATIDFVITTKTHIIRKNVNVSDMTNGFDLTAGKIKTFNILINDDTNCIIEEQEASIDFTAIYGTRTAYNESSATANPLPLYSLVYTGTAETISFSNLTASGLTGNPNTAGYWGSAGSTGGKNTDAKKRLSIKPDGYMVFNVNVKNAKSISLKELFITVKRANQNVPKHFEIQYRPGGSELESVCECKECDCEVCDCEVSGYTVIADIDITGTSGTANNTHGSYSVNLSELIPSITIPEGAEQTLTFRIVPYGGTASIGAWGLFVNTEGEPGLKLTGAIVE